MGVNNQDNQEGALGLSDIEEFLMNDVQMHYASMSDDDADHTYYNADDNYYYNDGYYAYESEEDLVHYEYESKEDLPHLDAERYYYSEGYEYQYQETDRTGDNSFI